MMEANVVQLIISLRNEFAGIHYARYFEDNENNRISHFLQKVHDSVESLQGEEKTLYEILVSTFALDYFNASFSGEDLTNINSQDLSQIETWTVLDFKNYISESFRKNDLIKESLKKISIEKYSPLFRGYEEDIAYYRTLQDWHLMRKINFLLDGGFFTKNELKENENKILAIYDVLINENEGNSKLYFMREKLLYLCSLDKELNKLQQLQTILKSDIDGDYKVLMMRDIMTIYRNDDKSREALEIADQAKKQFPNSPFLKEIQYKEDLMTCPELGLNFEKQIQSNKPIHIVAEYRNTSDFILNIYEVKGGFKSFIKYTEDYRSEEKFYHEIEKILIRKEHYTLPHCEIYEEMKTSLEIKPLPSGLYVAEFSSKDLAESDSVKNYFFTVSDYKIIYHHKDANDFPESFRLVNSENGTPIPNEEIVFFEYLRDQDLVKLNAKTDDLGVFKIPSDANNSYRKYLVHHPKTNDFQILDVWGRKFSEDQKRDILNKTIPQIFTDRTIYRPGQTVYFKVINTKIENEVETVVAGIKQKIALTDGNEEEISTQEFTTNEFGSYHGSFVLPKGKLNGTFALMIEDGADCFHTFRVEEYKRPKFEITFEPVKGEYQYVQTLELKGRATSFSGVPLRDVVVNYEITENDIRWKFFSRYKKSYGYYGNSILGKVKTDENGEFTISVTFEENTYLKGLQVDCFKIEASVTDINGETQSASVEINVASVPYYIKAEEIKDAFTDENIKIKVETKNYNNQDVEKPYHIKLSKLKSPDRIFRKMFEDKIQNLSQFSKEEFIAKFPHDYFDEDEYEEEVQIEKVILDKIYDPKTANQQPTANLDLGKLEVGRYELKLYDSQNEELIETSQRFNVWDKNSLKEEKVFLNVVDPKKGFLRGEKANIYVYSAIPDALVYIFLQDCLGNTIAEIKQLKNGILDYIVEIPKNKNISEINVQFQIIAYNEVQHSEITLKIKENENPLTIETIVFRDKIEPGSKEKWTVKITENNKNASTPLSLTAEILATMYDRSLDRFSVNTFKWKKHYVPYYAIMSYKVKYNLSARYASKEVPYVRSFSIEPPCFNWYEGDIPESLTFVGGACGYSGDAVLNELEGPKLHYKIAKGDEKERGISVGETHSDLPQVPVRQNLNETAFFYPDLRTDSEGNVSFEFTSPEALTKWKLMFLAHTKDAKAGTLEKEVVTQKEFSVTPNYPRFLREGDELNLQSKLSNLTSKKLSGSASLQILDAFTNEDISSLFGLNSSIQNFELNENGNSALTWKIKVPDNVSSIILKVVAKAGQYSDGEQKAVAVLPNRMLVTDAVPVFVKEGETKTFELENLKNATSTTISNVSNTLELTTNPIWEIMFALPSLKNDQNNSADVIFNKWFADVLASEIFKANPKLKTVFEEYQNKGLLNSNLEKNQELKQLLLEETPWVLESKNEEEQMAKLALLFDVNSMKNSIHQDWEDLEKLQNPDGGFSWYKGYPSSYSTSLYILKNLGKINVWLKDNVKDYQNPEQNEMVSNLIKYVDNEIEKYTSTSLSAGKENVINNWTLDYLDTRNYWEKQYPLKGKGATLKSLVKQKVKTMKITDFTFFGLHRTALLMNDYGLKEVSDKLLNYLKETSVDSKTQGVYWKQNLDDWGWFSSKVVNHAGALEVFNKLKPNDQKFIEDLKIWLVTQKEVNSWGSSRGTSEVIFTILNSGKSWTNAESDKATIVWGGKELQPQTQATGYVKSTVKSDVLDKNLATVTVTKPGAGIVQGGLFWQYYEDLDKIKSSENYLSITKELYRKIKTVNGEELQKITPETPLKVGDKVTVRMILNTDRPMEFIHIKDMRAAGFEPLDVLSGYQWKNGLGYYQSTKDASTNFYIEQMPKGKYVFEYDYVANASGIFSNGITTIQNYYAPQMNAHTKGDVVEIKSN
ncbi:alpha-2-macroglobulin family protein [Chryseobacterium gambrini]|uniref:alpha-2-macroglobulin family protein n=1 Tax=Chryseobacterium gambrini TaxID=373672 RepID=UPI003D099DAE